MQCAVLPPPELIGHGFPQRLFAFGVTFSISWAFSCTHAAVSKSNFPDSETAAQVQLNAQEMAKVSHLGPNILKAHVSDGALQFKARKFS